MLLTGGGEWSSKEIKAMTPRRATQAEYNLRAKQEVAKKEQIVKDAAYNKKLVENYKNNIKTFRVYDPITKSYSPANKEQYLSLYVSQEIISKRLAKVS